MQAGDEEPPKQITPLRLLKFGKPELPLVISDHADWDELTATLEEIHPGEVWVTHGRDDALVHWAQGRGIAARALALVGREDEDD